MNRYHWKNIPHHICTLYIHLNEINKIKQLYLQDPNMGKGFRNHIFHLCTVFKFGLRTRRLALFNRTNKYLILGWKEEKFVFLSLSLTFGGTSREI